MRLFRLIIITIFVCFFLHQSAPSLYAQLVDDLPTGNLLPDHHAWFHTEADTTTASLNTWTDASSVAGQITCSGKEANPYPYSGQSDGTAARNANGVGVESCGATGAGDVDAALYYVVGPTDSTKKLLKFTTHYVALDVTYFRFIISGGSSSSGPWTELWRPYQTTFKSTSGVWTQLEQDPVHLFASDTGYSYYKIQFEGRYASGNAAGQKFTGVYFAVDDLPSPSDYTTLTQGNTTTDNSSTTARSSATVSHNNNGNLLLVGIQLFGTTTTVPSVSSISYGGTALTEAGDNASITYSPLSNRHLIQKWYYIVGDSIPTGTNNLSVSYANNTRDTISIISISGANDTDPIGRTGNYSDSTSTTRMQLLLNSTAPKSRIYTGALVQGGSNGPLSHNDDNATDIVNTQTGSTTSNITFSVFSLAADTSDTYDVGTAAVNNNSFAMSSLEILSEPLATPTPTSTSTPTPTPSPTPSPTATPTQATISSLSVAAPTCASSIPDGTSPWLYAASAQTPSSILVQFQHSSTNATDYVIEYGTSPNSYTFATSGIGSRGTNNYLVQSLTPSTTYYFRIRASHNCATGPWSNEISATTPANKTISGVSSLTSSISHIDISSPPTFSQDLPLSTPIATSTTALTLQIQLQDPFGRPIPSAQVTLYSTPQIRITNSQGIAFFPSVSPGPHLLKISYKQQTTTQQIDLPDQPGSNIQLQVEVHFSPLLALFPPQLLTPLAIFLATICALIIILLFPHLKKH